MNPSQFRDIVWLKTIGKVERDREYALFAVDAVVFQPRSQGLFPQAREKALGTRLVGFKYKRNEGDSKSPNWVDKAAIVHSFDPTTNEWKQKQSTC